MSGVDVLAGLGGDLRRLIDLAADDDDPRCLLLGEEVERLPADDARALLMCAALLLALNERGDRCPST